LHCIAGIYANQGEVAKAIAFYQESLELHEKIGALQGKAHTFAMLGLLLADKKRDFDKALNYLQQSLDIWQHLRSPDAERVRKFIAKVQQMAGN
jgi:tetratricopeptide (TPR) repeat protein